MNCKHVISLIICSRNRASSLLRCLDAIDFQDLINSSGELILVNSNSSDETEQIMYRHQEKSPYPVQVITVPVPGLGIARNAGVNASSGEILIFTDDDCYLVRGYFSAVKKVFSQKEFDYCGGRILRYDPTDSIYGCNTCETYKIFPPYSLSSSMDAEGIQGACLVVHRKVFKKIGLFDPMLGAGTPFRGEDIDFSARASFAGFTGAHVPDLIVYHHHGRKPGEAIETLKRQNYYAMGAFYAKFILQGKYIVLLDWLKRRKRKSRTRIRIELRGAFDFTLTRFKRLFRMTGLLAS